LVWSRERAPVSRGLRLRAAFSRARDALVSVLFDVLAVDVPEREFLLGPSLDAVVELSVHEVVLRTRSVRLEGAVAVTEVYLGAFTVGGQNCAEAAGTGEVRRPVLRHSDRCDTQQDTDDFHLKQDHCLVQGRTAISRQGHYTFNCIYAVTNAAFSP